MRIGRKSTVLITMKNNVTRAQWINRCPMRFGVTDMEQPLMPFANRLEENSVVLFHLPGGLSHAKRPWCELCRAYMIAVQSSTLCHKTVAKIGHGDAFPD